jgi:uncharacterized protein YwqG
MAEYNLNNDLPKEGLLSFFVDIVPFKDFVDQKECVLYSSRELENADHWRVLYEPDVASIDRIEFPNELSSRGRCGAAETKQERILTMPHPDEPCYERLDIIIDNEKFLDYTKLCYPLNNTGCSRLLGNPLPFQSGMKLICECVTKGLTDDFYEDPRFPEIEKNVEDWQHLFTINDDQRLWEACDGMSLIGDGAIYFLIKKQDLIKRDFSKTWFIQQLS